MEIKTRTINLRVNCKGSGKDCFVSDLFKRQPPKGEERERERMRGTKNECGIKYK